jgi:uncharacterized membrane protein YidH (DUF202 family)
MSLVDPGLQPQRTALAWHRTGLAVLVNALVVLRAGAKAEQPFILALGIILLVAAVGAAGCGAWRARRLAMSGTPSAPPHVLVLGTVVVAWLACIAGLASIAITLLA